MATELILPRRKLITGLVALICAPAIVRASSLMAVKALPPEDWIIPGWEPVTMRQIKALYRVIYDTEHGCIKSIEQVAA